MDHCTNGPIRQTSIDLTSLILHPNKCRKWIRVYLLMHSYNILKKERFCSTRCVKRTTSVHQNIISFRIEVIAVSIILMATFTWGSSICRRSPSGNSSCLGYSRATGRMSCSCWQPTAALARSSGNPRSTSPNHPSYLRTTEQICSHVYRSYMHNELYVLLLSSVHIMCIGAYY
jgi:hypothetical protein